MRTFEIRDTFYLDGEPFQILSGSIHYFRVVPAYWRDRLLKLKAMGLNTVETYVPWNIHEPKKGRFDFSGMRDVEAFVRLAQELGLCVILRPSPYICAEWEFGGQPAWLLAEEGIRLRCSDPCYMTHVLDYYDELMKRLTPLQITRGGPVIMMQVENEYGSYGDDPAYLDMLRDAMRARGVDVPLFTSDGAEPDMLACGRCEGVFRTGNFGAHTAERFGMMTQHGIKPLMCTEFWCGWFDHWGAPHSASNPGDCVRDFEEILRMGHVNIYMFHGGTSFGLMNGANHFDRYEPQVTSYDYDAVLTEDGRITEKYRLFRQAIEAHRGEAAPEIAVAETPRRAYGEAQRTSFIPLLEAVRPLPSVRSVHPVSMERLGQSYGYTLYHTVLVHERTIRRIQLLDAGDRAQVMLDGRVIATLLAEELERPFVFEEPVWVREGASLDILVENLGRVNYGDKMERQRKGIDRGVLINAHFHYGWDITCLDEDAMRAMGDANTGEPDGVPGVHRAVFHVDAPADTFLELAGWGKGVVQLNGFTLGRFWEIGPQRRLYVPAPLLTAGKNELTIVETEGRSGEIWLRDAPDLG